MVCSSGFEVDCVMAGSTGWFCCSGNTQSPVVGSRWPIHTNFFDIYSAGEVSIDYLCTVFAKLFDGDE